MQLPLDPVHIDSDHPLLQDLPEDFFNIDSFDSPPPHPPTSPPSSPYLGPTQPPARLASYIARCPYTTEPLRHDLGPMDQKCDSCSALSWKDEKLEWCCDKGKTEVGASETDITLNNDDDDNEDDDMLHRRERQSSRERGHEGFKTSTNAPINPNEAAINRILHSVRPGTSSLTDDCKEYRRYSVQYNNAASMASKRITINHAVAPYTCKVQGAITTHMPALAPSEGEQLVFEQIYIMDSTQDQSITRSVHIPVILMVF